LTCVSGQMNVQIYDQYNMTFALVQGVLSYIGQFWHFAWLAGSGFSGLESAKSALLRSPSTWIRLRAWRLVFLPATCYQLLSFQQRMRFLSVQRCMDAQIYARTLCGFAFACGILKRILNQAEICGIRLPLAGADFASERKCKYVNNGYANFEA